MSRTATLPPIRIAPETKARLEAVLRKGESLTQFIESAVSREAEFRAEQKSDPTLAETALHWQDATHQTLLRLPLSIMMLIVFIVGCTHLFKALRGPIADVMPGGSA